MHSVRLVRIVVPLSTLILAGCITPPPHVSPPSGIYRCPQTITLTDSAPGVSVFYTEDGSKPTAQSKKYAGPFTTAANSVQAIAQARGGKVSKVSAASYSCALTRGEFAVLLQQRFSLPPPKQKITFPDIAPSDPILAAVQAAAPFMNQQVLCPTCELSRKFFPDLAVNQATTALSVVRVLVAKGQLKLLAPAEAKALLSKSPDARALPSEAARQYFATAIAHNLMSLSPSREIQLGLMRNRPDIENLLDRAQAEFNTRDKPQ